MVLGGKSELGSQGWLKSVESLNMTYYMYPHLRPKQKDPLPPYETYLWEDLAPMKNCRANFAAIVLDNLVYVYGGISGKKEVHHPVFANQVVERYSPNTKEWSELKIDNAPNVAAFAWAPLLDHKIAIYGGTDGDLITSDLWIIDFKKEQAEFKKTQNEQPIANGKLAYTAHNDSLVLIAGYGSEGVNYTMKFSDGEWVASEKSHSALIGETDLELPYKSAVYFP